MAFPGPGLPEWGIALLAFAGAVAALGDLVRSAAARWVPFLRTLDPIERGLVDLYAGGAVFYVLAAGAGFYPSVLPGILLAGSAVAVLWALARHRPSPRSAAAPIAGSWKSAAPYLLAAGSALFLLAMELAATDGVGSGNTFDSSLLATYTSLLLTHHALPLSLAPVAAGPLAYPQGTTVWLGLAQSLFGLPPLRTSLLVTPLFLALVPLAAFSFGRRLLGGPRAGAVLALVFALLAGVTSGLVAGSNDFVLALPLVLVLLAWTSEWVGPTAPSLPFALLFGALAGYAAALNPVGPAWLFLSLLVLGLLGSSPGPRRAVVPWLGRWGLAVAAAVPFVLPSILSAGSVTGAAGGPGAVGESPASFVSDVDPFLFRPGDQLLSYAPVLRAELAGLILLGAAYLLLGRGRLRYPMFVRTVLAGFAAGLGLLGVGLLAYEGVPLATGLFALLNASELARWLFVLYTVVAAVPLVRLALALPEGPGLPTAGLPVRSPRAFPGQLRFATIVVIAGLLLPGAVVAGTSAPTTLHATYLEFSNLTAADVDFLAWAGSHMPAGAVVLVAPGSVAGFLPAYLPSVVLQYPMSIGFLTAHPAYWTVVHELQNGTLDANGHAALASLGTEYVAVTENNTVLYAPFQPAALVGYPVDFQEGGVFLYDVRGATPALGGPG